MKNYFFILFLFLNLFSQSIYAQKNYETIIKDTEDSLTILFDSLYRKQGPRYCAVDKEKQQLNKHIVKLFSTIMSYKETMEYPFSQLPYVSIQTSKDKKVRLYVWDTRNDDYTHTYRGFVQYYLSRKKKVVWKYLNDYSDSISNPQSMRLDNKHWYGNLIYEIVEEKYHRKKYYTLIGWDENNLLTSKKIIDVLYFSSSGRPHFGRRMFVVGRKKYFRLIYEYSAKVAMVVHYDKRYDMIVMDHLSPPQKLYTGLYQFYGPDGSYDGLVFKKGKWHLVPNIKVVNKKRKGIKENATGKPPLPKIK